MRPTRTVNEIRQTQKKMEDLKKAFEAIERREEKTSKWMKATEIMRSYARINQNKVDIFHAFHRHEVWVQSPTATKKIKTNGKKDENFQAD